MTGSSKSTRAVILHGAVAADPRPDNADTLVQVAAVGGALADLGYAIHTVELTLDLSSCADRLRSLDPGFVFNLVESVAGRDSLLPLGPMLLESLDIPFTGNRAVALQATTDKLSAKRIMRAAGIATPDWRSAVATGIESGAASGGPRRYDDRYIIKSASEHASFGLDAASVVQEADVHAAMADRRRRHGGDWFAECFIDGRELNLALLAGPEGPQLLPPAEIDFNGFAPDEPRIVGYAAKWEVGSVPYRSTTTRADFPASDQTLLSELAEIARRCWTLFGLSGYARVDFRVDPAGRPWVLEINANPCIAPDAGFMLAAERAGLSFVEVVARLVADAVPATLYTDPA